MTRPLTVTERDCLTCPLRDCLPEHPLCPQQVMKRQARARKRRRRK
jgi:hypothetical protein